MVVDVPSVVPCHCTGMVANGIVESVDIILSERNISVDKQWWLTGDLVKV